MTQTLAPSDLPGLVDLQPMSRLRTSTTPTSPHHAGAAEVVRLVDHRPLVSMCACIPTYMLASGLIENGMNWWQAILTIFLANVIVLIPMVLNAHAGVKYGSVSRLLPRQLRHERRERARHGAGDGRLRVVGIQCWIGGAALLAIACIFKPELANPSWRTQSWRDSAAVRRVHGLWLLNIIVIFAGIDSIRWLLNIKAPLLIVLGLTLLGWAYFKAGGLATCCIALPRSWPAVLRKDNSGTPSHWD